MRMMNVNPLLSVNACNLKNIHTNTSEIIITENSSRIKTLQEDILYFRGMIEKVAHQKTEMMESYASILKSCDAILKSCDSALRGNYHKTHKKYLDLLHKAQALEAEMHLRALEGELDTLIKNQTAEVEIEASWIA